MNLRWQRREKNTGSEFNRYGVQKKKKKSHNTKSFLGL